MQVQAKQQTHPQGASKFVKRHFSRAAAGYEGGYIHHQAARCLGGMLTRTTATRWLDIGCGTGNFAEFLAHSHNASTNPIGDTPEGSTRTNSKATANSPLDSPLKVFADLSLPMLRQVTTPKALPVVADAESPPFRQSGFDLVTSVMAMQWCSLGAIGRLMDLVAPKGTLAIALPVAPSLSNWLRLCRRHSIQSRLLSFHSLRELEEILPPARRITLKMERGYQNPLGFAKRLRQWGATAPSPLGLAARLPAGSHLPTGSPTRSRTPSRAPARSSQKEPKGLGDLSASNGSSPNAANLLKLKTLAEPFVANWHIACIVVVK